MFPHKYTTLEDAAALIPYFEALQDWAKVKPYRFATLPIFRTREHPHGKDPRVIREFIALKEYTFTVWLNTRNL